MKLFVQSILSLGLVFSVNSVSAQVMRIPGGSGAIPEHGSSTGDTNSNAPTPTVNQANPAQQTPANIAPRIVQPGEINNSGLQPQTASFVLTTDSKPVNPVVQATLRGFMSGQGITPVSCSAATVVIKVNDYYTACGTPGEGSSVQPGKYDLQLTF